MKTLRNSILCALFLSLPCVTGLFAQSSNDENYYSNPRKGIKASAPKAYYDTSVVAKSDNITVVLEGESMDTTQVPTDSIKGNFDSDQYYDYAYTARINRFHRNMRWSYFDDYYTNLYWYTGNPYYWGTSIYYTWDPWYNPYWNGWYHAGWGGSYWHTGWGWHYGWSMGWGYDPFWGVGYYSYAPYYHYYDPWFWGGYRYHRPGVWAYGNPRNNTFDRYGHSYMGLNTDRHTSTLRPQRTNPSSVSPSSSNTLRRGGVDINNGGRGYYRNVSGTGSQLRNASRSTTNTATASNRSTTRYSHPESVNNSRSGSIRSNGSREAYGNTNRASTYRHSESNVSTGTRSAYRSYGIGSSTERSSSSRSGSTFSNSRSSSSRSSSFDNSRSSSTRSSGSSFSGSRSSSSRSSSFGGSHSSSSRSSGSSFSGSRSSSGGSHNRR